MVAFTVDGQSVSVSVDGNGDATARLTLPLLTAAFPQSINAAFSGPNFAPTSASQIVFFEPINTLAPSVATFAADGSESVQSYLFGLPLLDFLYTPQGRLSEIVFGPDLLNWDLSYSVVLAVLRLDGMLPVMVSVTTPQGQFLGAVALTVSANGAAVVELIGAQGQVVSSRPL
jgi:hypothetical protein